MATDIRKIIHSFYQDLSQSEMKIADFLLAQPETAGQMSIQALSQATGFSTATISRFAKRLGYQSFQELKIALSIPTETDSQELFSDLTPEDDALTLAKKIFAANIHSLEDTAAFLDQKNLNASLEIMLQAQRGAFFGLGGSQIVALDAYHKFLRTDLDSHFQNDYHMQLMFAAKLTPQDCAIVISHTGRNRETMQILKVLQKNQVPIIAITSYAASPLAKDSAVALIACAEETSYRSEALSAMQAQFSLVDTLFMLYSVAKYDENNLIRQKVRDTIKETRQ